MTWAFSCLFHSHRISYSTLECSHFVPLALLQLVVCHSHLSCGTQKKYTSLSKNTRHGNTAGFSWLTNKEFKIKWGEHALLERLLNKKVIFPLFGLRYFGMKLDSLFHRTVLCTHFYHTTMKALCESELLTWDMSRKKTSLVNIHID